MAEQKQEMREEQFRGALAESADLAKTLAGEYKDVAKLVQPLLDLSRLCEKLSSCCDNLDDLIRVLELAGENNGQLRLLMRLLLETQRK